MADCTGSIDALKPSEAITCAAQGVGNFIRRFADGIDSIPLGQWAAMFVVAAIIVAGIACVILTAKFLERLIKWFGQKEELERTDEGKLRQRRWGAFIMVCGFASFFLANAGSGDDVCDAVALRHIGRHLRIGAILVGPPPVAATLLAGLTDDCLQRLPRCPLLLDAVEPRLHSSSTPRSRPWMDC